MRAAGCALAALALHLAGAAGGVSAERLPPAPSAYFNDYAGVVAADVARRLDQRLREFEKETSTQVLVAVFPELPSPALEDFTIRTAESWKAGRKELDNGAVLFVFVNDRKMRIEVGYGLEGALPDAIARRILDNEVRPRFRAGDFAGGLEAGVEGIIAATKGEYQAPPPEKVGISPLAILIVFLLVLLLLVWTGSYASRHAGAGGFPRGRTYGRRGWDDWKGGSWGGGFGGRGGGWSGGGGFSGGGGSFGGGGASSSW
jgi:uncharacterized protein